MCHEVSLFIMFFYKGKYILQFEPDHGFRLLSAITWAFPPDTWQQPLVRGHINPWQAAIKEPLHILSVQQWLYVEFMFHA